MVSSVKCNCNNGICNDGFGDGLCNCYDGFTV